MPNLREKSKSRKWRVFVICLAAGVAGQVIVKGLSNCPWFFNAKVGTGDIMTFVNDAAREYQKKWEGEEGEHYDNY